jgi:hypothetical protein
LCKGGEKRTENKKRREEFCALTTCTLPLLPAHRSFSAQNVANQLNRRKKMKIQVKTVLYKLLTLEVEETETIRDVVQRVQLLEGRDTPYDLEGLAYGGKILPPTSTVADQAIPPDATLHQVKRGLRGASTPANQQP